MRIVHCMRYVRLEQGGVVRAVLDMCGALAASGHDVRMLCIDDTDVPEPWKAGGRGLPSVHRIPRPVLPATGYLPWQLARVFEPIKDADVVHLHSAWQISNIQIGRFCRARSIPYVISVHGMLDDWCMSQRGLKKRLFMACGQRRLLERAAFVHCTAQAERDQSRKWYPGGRGRVIPLVVDLSPFREMPGPALAQNAFPPLREDRAKILFISRLHYKKGVEHLIRSADILRNRGVEASVVIAGSGDASYERRLRALVDELGLSDRVSFLGMVAGPTKISLYQASDLVVLPTSQENFGFVVFEALASGTPLITTPGVDTWPEVEASGGGLIVAQDPAKIADAIGLLLADTGRRSLMGESGRAWALRELDPALVVQRFVEMYADAMKGPGASGTPG